MTSPRCDASATNRPALVRWPDELARRESLASAGVPRLLVVDRREPIPVLVDGEDWISGASDERDVATRLARLARVARDRIPGGRATAPVGVVLPAGLDADEHRVASHLLRRIGGFVRSEDLDVDDLPAVIVSLRRSLAPAGYRIRTVGRAGYLVERPTEPPR